MDIYLVRHGQTEYNAQSRYYGYTDLPLNERGRAEAEELALIFSDIKLDKILSSPLIRAYETAKIISKKNKVEIEKNALLCEQNFGIFEGLTYLEIKKKYPKELRAWNQDFLHTAPPGGESFEEVRGRAEQFLQDLKRREEKSILIVAHKGTFGHLAAAMLGLLPEGFWNFVFEQGKYSQISLEDGYAIIKKINK